MDINAFKLPPWDRFRRWVSVHRLILRDRLNDHLRPWWYRLSVSRWPFVMKATMRETINGEQQFHRANLAGIARRHAAELDRFRTMMAPVLDKLGRVEFGSTWRVPVAGAASSLNARTVNCRGDYLLEYELSSEMLAFALLDTPRSDVPAVIQEVARRIALRVEHDMTVFMATGKIPKNEDEG